MAGCVNDMNDIREYLLGRGWDPSQIHCLQDEAANMEAVVRELEWLINTRGKELLFCYSGHGSQIPTNDPDEPDGKKEIICPYDCTKHWDTPVSDDVLKGIFASKASGSYLTVILDSCHAQHGTRGIIPQPEGRVIRSKYMRSPFKESAPGQDTNFNRFAVKQEFGYGPTSEGMNHILLSACMSSQTSADADFGGRPNGAWTWALVKALKSLPPSVKTHDLFYQAALNVRENGFSQRPCLEGRTELKERPFLGGGV